MTTTEQETYDKRILHLLRQYGTVTPNKLASVTIRKQETAKASLDRLEDQGLVYSTKTGNRTYYTLMPGGNNKRVKPDRKRLENRTDGVAQPSNPPSIPSQPPFQLHRANNRLEVIPERGFVCYPSVTGSEVSRDYIRTHIDGEYQVKIHKIGEFKTTDYIPNSDIRIRWEKFGLSTNISMVGSIYTPQEKEPFKIRTVSGKNGKFTLLSVWVHPRYIYYVGKELTAEFEFVQQVRDISAILNHFGWDFRTDSIQLVGNVHYAINDTNLAARVGRYAESDSDIVHYDQSHGIPEAEIYSDRNGYKTDPETVEIMVKLPEIVKSLTASIVETNKQITMLETQIVTILGIQAKTLVPSEPPKQPKNDFSNEWGMYQ